MSKKEGGQQGKKSENQGKTSGEKDLEGNGGKKEKKS